MRNSLEDVSLQKVQHTRNTMINWYLVLTMTMVFYSKCTIQITIILQILLVSALAVGTSQKTSGTTEKVFVFPEFDYVESPKNEIAWREWEAACEQTPACLGIVDLEKVKCVRRCMSPSCYHDIYAFDELEEGEIDIRFQSFKGCFASRITRKRY